MGFGAGSSGTKYAVGDHRQFCSDNTAKTNRADARGDLRHYLRQKSNLCEKQRPILSLRIGVIYGFNRDIWASAAKMQKAADWVAVLSDQCESVSALRSKGRALLASGHEQLPLSQGGGA